MKLRIFIPGRLLLLLIAAVSVCLFSPVLGSYDTDYGGGAAHHAYPVHHHGQSQHQHGWGAQPAGSYYHYHVPLVGQQQSHYHPQPSHHDNHLLWLLLPLLLLLALPLLLLPLLPLFLIPTGLALLALLMPMMMMMAGAMMMMMMMMGGGMMMMPPMMMKRDLGSTLGEGSFVMRTIGEILMGDVTSLVSRYSRSLDLDRCPERVSCEIGSAMFPMNASRTSTAKSFVNYVIDHAVPSGKTQEILRTCRDALFEGSKLNTCQNFHCQPKFKIYDSEEELFVSKSNGPSLLANTQTINTSKIGGSTSSTKSKIVLKRKQSKNNNFNKKVSSAGSKMDDYYQQEYLFQQQQYTVPPAVPQQASIVVNATSASLASGQVPHGIKSDRILQQQTPYNNNNYYYYQEPQENNELLRSNQGYGGGVGGKQTFLSRLGGTPVARV